MHSAYLGSENYHKILGLEYDATPDEIKRAYRQLAKKYHPDINPLPDAHNLFIEITEAYEILINRNLHHLYVEEDTATDRETRRAEYEKARQAARESAQRYARMKYEKFRQEQEAFKKSGWHDLILTFRYFIRILLFPLIAFFIAMPLINEAVAEHPSGLVMMWLLASILILFVANNWKSYFNLDPYYYSLADINKLIRDSARITGEDCYYCKGHKAISFPYKIMLFRVRKIQLKSYGGLYGRTAGVDRILKTVRIPRSRKAFIIHAICTLFKLLSILGCLILIRKQPYSYFSLPAGIFMGSIISMPFASLFSTKSKVTYLLSPGMIIKILIWLTSIYFLAGNAILLLFFDPMIEVIIRQISRDKLFIPLLRQHPKVETLFKKRYQSYLELPVWSVISPFFKWLF